MQAGAIPPALEGADILATASTGTGKTLSFLIPMIEKMDAHPVSQQGQARPPSARSSCCPRASSPCRCSRRTTSSCPAAKGDAVLVCGGLSEGNQLDQLSRGPRLVVATPGRLEDYLRRRAIKLDEVEMFVLDEVDRMLDMGFLPAIKRIVQAVPKTRQTMCYSATLDANIREIVKDYVRNPVRVEIGQTSKPSDRVELRVYTVMQDQKLAQLDKMLNEEEAPTSSFSRTKHGADRIAKKLDKLGHATEVIHGDRSQSQRTAALKSFTVGKSRILVATDVAARGIDVSHIAHVVNYDLPNGSDDFVHRIGRTGRAGAKGVATTFITPLEKSDARKLERELKIQFDWRVADKNLAREERNKPIDLPAERHLHHAADGNAFLEERRRHPVGAHAAARSPDRAQTHQGLKHRRPRPVALRSAFGLGLRRALGFRQRRSQRRPPQPLSFTTANDNGSPRLPLSFSTHNSNTQNSELNRTLQFYK